MRAQFPLRAVQFLKDINMEHNQEHDSHENKHGQYIDVAISTTSGFFPATGFERLSFHQKVEVQLGKAVKTLNLTDTTGWIATVDKRTINPQQSYEENDLHGEVEIDWGPTEGGGGNA